jgi:hypothetical protein
MCYVVGKDDVDALRNASRPKEYVSARKPLLALLNELSRRSDCNLIHFQKDRLNVTFERKPVTAAASS